MEKTERNTSMENKNASKKTSFGWKFMHQTLKRSDFKFIWGICKDNYFDWTGLENDQIARQCYLTCYNNKTLPKKKLQELRKTFQERLKMYRKPYVFYKLVRRSVQDKMIKDAILAEFKTTKNKAYKKFINENPNVKLYREVLAAEQKKERTFSSLSKMQDWVDDNLDGSIDIYSLWEAEQAKQSKSRTCK